MITVWSEGNRKSPTYKKPVSAAHSGQWRTLPWVQVAGSPPVQLQVPHHHWLR